MTSWFRLWFSFSEPVDRGTYFRHGVGLMVFKYGVDAGLIWLFAHRFWTPIDYLSPALAVRAAKLAAAPNWLLLFLMAWTLPFLWIGISMSMRRALDAGRSPWLALLFFVPLVNYAFMGIMSVLPSERIAPRVPFDRSFEQAKILANGLVAVATGSAISVAMALFSIYVLKSYGTALFLGTPFVHGAVGAYVFNAQHPRTLNQTFEVVGLSMLLVVGAFILFAIEGAICIALVLVPALGISLLGGLFGRAIALLGGGRGAHVASVVIALPGVVALDAVERPLPVHEVISSIEIDAPPEAVWRHVVEFSELPPPTQWLFSTGIAYPMRARIEGVGVGAVRYCEFSTGAFVEPITAWEEPTLLAFDVVEQPAPLEEWSPYRGITPPHLDGYFQSRRGEFRLLALPGGRTRLEGSTWYTLEMTPQIYWKVIADALVHRIHARVLEHVSREATR